MTRLKSGLANIWSTRGMKKPGSSPCGSCTFHCSTLLASILPKTRSFTFRMFRDMSRRLKLRKRRRNSLRKKLPSPLSPAAVWICIKVIGLAKELQQYSGHSTYYQLGIERICLSWCWMHLPWIRPRTFHKSHITTLLQAVPEWNVSDIYASKLKICIYIYIICIKMQK